MLIKDLQTHLQNCHRTSLADLERQFKLDAETLRAMLSLLIRKGRVSKVDSKACPGCCSCDPEALEFYEWTTSRSC